MRYLVCGTGRLGSVAAKTLAAQGAVHTAALENADTILDLSDEAASGALLQSARPDVVVFLAGQHRPAADAPTALADQFLPLAGFLRALRHSAGGPVRVVYASALAASSPRDAFSHTKYLAEELLRREVAENDRVSVSVLRLPDSGGTSFAKALPQLLSSTERFSLT